jgi:hypothetical protein
MSRRAIPFALSIVLCASFAHAVCAPVDLTHAAWTAILGRWRQTSRSRVGFGDHASGSFDREDVESFRRSNSGGGGQSGFTH